MLIDSHCHLLHTFHPELLPEKVETLRQNFHYLVDISTNVKDFLNSCAIKLPGFILRAAGLYPETAPDYSATVRKEFIHALEQHPVQAIGEVGLDFHWNYGTPAQQEALFRDMIEISLEKAKPLIIHSRDAFEDTFRILNSYSLKYPVILHCYSYGPEEAARMGYEGPYYFSFAGNLTYKNAHQLQSTAAQVPLEKLLLETDSPYLSPLPHRGQSNQPQNISHTYDFLAELRQIDRSRLDEQLLANFRAAFMLTD